MARRSSGRGPVRVARSQLRSVEDHCETARAALIDLSDRLDGDGGQTALRQALADEPPLAATCRSIRTNTFETLHRQLSKLVAGDSESAGDLSVATLDDAVAEMGDHHRRLMEAVARLEDLAAADGFDDAAARRTVADAIRAVDHVRTTVELLGYKLAEASTTIESTDQPAYQVTGLVIHGDEPLPGVTVRAVDVDRASEQRLGEAITDEEGRYRITYTRPDFSRAERGGADLVVRVHDEVDAPIGASRRRHGVSREATVDVEIPADVRIEPTEYARLRAELEPLVRGTSVGALSDSDVSFLVAELELGDRDVYPADERSLVFLREAAALSGRTPFGEQALYGIARLWNGIGHREELAGASADELVETIHAAVEEWIVDVDTEELASSVERALERLRAVTERAAKREATATVAVFDDQRRPLRNYEVEITDATESGRSRTVRTDQAGRAGFSYLTDEAGENRRFVVSVHNDGGTSIHEETIQVGDGSVREVTVEEPGQGASGRATVGELHSTGVLPVSDEVASSLEDVTLDEIRVAGLDELDVPLDPDQPDGELLNSMANMELTTDLGTASTLGDLGFAGAVDVATTTPSAFGRRTAESLPADVAEIVHSRSAAQSFYLDSRMVERRAALANGQFSRGLPDDDPTVPSNGGED